MECLVGCACWARARKGARKGADGRNSNQVDTPWHKWRPGWRALMRGAPRMPVQTSTASAVKMRSALPGTSRHTSSYLPLSAEFLGGPSLHARNKGPAGASMSTCRSATRARSPPRFQSLCSCPLPPSRQSPSVCRAPRRRRPCRGGRCLAGTSHATGTGPRMPARKRKPVKLCTRVPFGDQARCKLGLYISRW
jgi:hypothetical protein